jgi:hypothetical protein
MGEKEVFHEDGQVFRENRKSTACEDRVPEGMERRMLRVGRGGGNWGDDSEKYPCRVRDKAFPAVVSSIIKGKRICGIRS